MKKITFLLFAFIMIGSATVQAQTVDEGRQMVIYNRVQSAKEILNKIIASDPKDAAAIYWLGQAYLAGAEPDVAGAKKVYQDALTRGVNDPLVWVGMGHVELLENKKDAAKQRFEAAITETSRKKRREIIEDPVILNLIGRANADGDSKIGDPLYAIEKLKRAIELDPNFTDAYINLGINYLKLGTDHGGDAYEAFTNAIRIDPRSGRPRFRLGKIFESQNNVNKFIDYYIGATEADPKFAPSYLQLYSYYADRDVNKAKEYLEKYMANADKDCGTDYFYGDYLFRAGKYQESLEKAKAMENGECKTFTRLPVLFAYNYDRLGDTAKAASYIQNFINNTSPEKIQPDDYLFAASALKKIPGREDAAIKYLKVALDNDTVRANRFKYMDTIANLYKNKGDAEQRIFWLKKSFETNPNPSNLDIYNMADAAINAGKFNLADSFSRMYIQKYPEQEYGYVLLVRGAKAADPDSSKGSAFDEVEEYVTFLKHQDSVKNGNKIKYLYYYVASVYADKLKDYPNAIVVLEKVQAIDPEDPFALQALPILRKAVENAKKSGKSK
jgi:tetratricopeptide (TPR) repeat protein